jgi:S1-C subfamily serine protease
MHLRTVELLDLSLREQLSIQHNINRGFIVDRVTLDSSAERLGIRQGDVIVLDELCGSTLPQVQI